MDGLIEVKNPERVMETVSILEIVSTLAMQWRIIACVTAGGLLISLIQYLTFIPTHYSSFIVQVGASPNAQSFLPLEKPFLLARRLKLKFEQKTDQFIETTVYENDFDELKRRTIEVTVAADSAGKALRVSEAIAEFVITEHQKLVSVCSDEIKKHHRATEERIDHSVRWLGFFNDHVRAMRKEINAAPRTDADNYAKEILSYLDSGVVMLEKRLQDERNQLDKLICSPTIITLPPNGDAIRVTQRSAYVLLKGVLGGLFFGCLAAAVALTLSKRRRNFG